MKLNFHLERKKGAPGIEFKGTRRSGKIHSRYPESCVGRRYFGGDRGDRGLIRDVKPGAWPGDLISNLEQI